MIIKDVESTVINGKSNGKSEARDVAKDLPKTTKVNQVTNFISQGLTKDEDLAEIISSENESIDIPEQECDSDAIDTNVIEADMDLEELMRQKELLQAQLANDLGEEDTESKPKEPKDNDVILLSDSEEDEVNKKPPHKESSKHPRDRDGFDRARERDR